MTTMRGDDHLMSILLRASAPLLVWGAHFFLCYAFIAIGCTAGIGGTMLKAVVLAATALALAAAVAMAVRPWRRINGPAPGRLRDLAALCGAGLAVMGMGWTLIPLWLLGVCGR
jgi:hypothetical protein